MNLFGKRSMFRVVALSCLTQMVLLGTVSVRAEVITVDGTVKSVDAKKRTITVETVSKTVTLDVSSKAKISIDGQDAGLGTLKTGQKISLSYHDKLEIVLKIVAGPMFDGDVKQKSGCRIVWHISETGDCTIRLGRPSANRTSNETVSKGLKTVRQDDGTWLCEHQFTSKDALEGLSGRSIQNASIAEGKGHLVLTPKVATGYKFNLAEVQYPYRLRLPLTLELDIEEMGADGKLQVNVTCPTPPNLHPFLDLGTLDGFKATGTINVGWIASRDVQGKPTFEKLLDKTVNLSSPFVESFRLPVPNMPIDDVFDFYLARFGESPALISRLVVRGRLIPVFGVGWKEKANVVFAATVLPKGLADRAGVRVGDILVNVNGEKPGTVEHAVKLMSKVGFGQACNLSLRRGGEELALKLKAD
jgi:hypothetical protein